MNFKKFPINEEYKNKDISSFKSSIDYYIKVKV